MNGKVGNKESITPIINTILEEIEQWHGIISENVNEYCFKLSLDKVNNEKNSCNANVKFQSGVLKDDGGRENCVP